MTGATLSLIMDGLIILLLAGTIFYALRLSKYIKVFRDSRKDLEKLLADLSSQIEKAEDAVEGLRTNARQSGRDLQALINEAKGLSDELQIMSESGNSLAGRLEKLAERRTGGTRESSGFDLPSRPLRKKSEDIATENDPLSAFSIRDPEFDEALDGDMNEDGLLPGDYDEGDSNAEFASEAEKDLYEALRRRKKTEAGGVS